MSARWSGRRVTQARATIRAQGRVQACWRCGQPMDLDVERWQVGHIIDRALGGTNDPGNTAPEHGRCNESAGGKLAQSRVRARRRDVVERDQKLRRW